MDDASEVVLLQDKEPGGGPAVLLDTSESRTLADAVTIITATPHLTPRQQQDLVSALRTISRILGEDLARLPVNRRAMGRRLDRIAPLAHGISLPAWSNVRSRLDTVLDLALEPHLRRRRNLQLEPEWKALQERIADQWMRKTLSRFFQCCGRAGIPPAAVDEIAMQRFAAYLERESLKNPAARLRDTRTAWNRACRDVPGWSGKPLATKPRSKDTYGLPWETFPPSLYDEVKSWLAVRKKGSATDYLAALKAEQPRRRPRRKSRPITLQLREYQVRLFASALVARGIDPASLRRLADLVRPDMLHAGLDFYAERHGKATPALPGLVAVLLAIARDWVRVGADDLLRIQNCLSDIREELPRGFMTRKNTDRLRAFNNPGNALALLRLPGRLYELAGQTSQPHQAALLVADALTIEILLMALLRVSNLAALDTVRHLIPVDRSRGAIHLVIPGNEVKNGVDLEYPLPPPAAALLQRYLTDFRPVLADPGSTALFPGQLGRPRNPQAFGRRITRVVFEHTQLTMNPHLFRHTMAKLYLRLFPRDKETLRIALGHRTLATTNGYYIEAGNAAALQHFNTTILDSRGGVPW